MHDQYDDPTCWAFADATVLKAWFCPKVDHDSLRIVLIRIYENSEGKWLSSLREGKSQDELCRDVEQDGATPILDAEEYSLGVVTWLMNEHLENSTLLLSIIRTRVVVLYSYCRYI